MSETKARKLVVFEGEEKTSDEKLSDLIFQNLSESVKKLHPNSKWSILLMMHQEIEWRVETKVDNS